MKGTLGVQFYHQDENRTILMISSICTVLCNVKKTKILNVKPIKQNTLDYIFFILIHMNKRVKTSEKQNAHIEYRHLSHQYQRRSFRELLEKWK